MNPLCTKIYRIFDFFFSLKFSLKKNHKRSIRQFYSCFLWNSVSTKLHARFACVQTIGWLQFHPTAFNYRFLACSKNILINNSKWIFFIFHNYLFTPETKPIEIRKKKVQIKFIVFSAAFFWQQILFPSEIIFFIIYFRNNNFLIGCFYPNVPLNRINHLCFFFSNNQPLMLKWSGATCKLISLLPYETETNLKIQYLLMSFPF